MKKKKTLKASFIVTVAAGAAAGSLSMGAAGCFVSTTNPPPADDCPAVQPAIGSACDASGTCTYSDECENDIVFTCPAGAWEAQFEGTCNPPMVECPETLPANETACDGIGTCEYIDDCGLSSTASCEGGQWAVTPAAPCNPPILECPDLVPATGEACVGIGTCEYSDECGLPITATCDGASWAVQYEGTCNPPPPCEFLGEEGCGLDPTCVWHEPGCGDSEIPALPAAGCFSVTPCSTDADCPAGTCQQVMVAPSCLPECDACGEAVSVCVQAP
ncbi:MAG: hypothetical protein R3B70_11720 [Polyangiaceae bacterium]